MVSIRNAGISGGQFLADRISGVNHAAFTREVANALIEVDPSFGPRSITRVSFVAGATSDTAFSGQSSSAAPPGSVRLQM